MELILYKECPQTLARRG